MQENMVIQSNSMRGHDVQRVVKRVVDEMLQDLAPAFGPGASDYFMISDGSIYYTRDGMEISKTLTFDNELAKQIHNIMFQAADRQAKKVGDGTTTLFLYYCFLYKRLYDELFPKEGSCFHKIGGNINSIRVQWKKVVQAVKDELKKITVPMTNEYLLSMLYTATQDAELSAAIYSKLRDPIMEGAYIIPRKSNISTDFEMTTYMNPLFRVTKQFTLRETDHYKTSCFMFCNGVLDIAHYEVLAAMIQRLLNSVDADGNEAPVSLDIIILCHGVSERTRKTLRELMKFLRDLGINPADASMLNNLTIFTLDDYRNFSAEEMEDLATIITDEPGLGGIVQPLTFERNLYKAFYPVSERSPAIEDLEMFDADPHLVTKIQEMFRTVCSAEYDEIEGLAIHKDLGPHAQVRYNALRKEIEEEKSEVRKVALNKRLKRSYGMFIDIQVGSALLKDSQRKYELILDAIISASTGVREGVIVGNSILHTIKILSGICQEKLSNERTADFELSMEMALLYTMGAMILNSNGEDFSLESVVKYSDQIIDMVTSEKYEITDFNLTADDSTYWLPTDVAAAAPVIPVTMDDGTVVGITNMVVEPYGIMAEILENSIVPVELLKTKVFHIAGSYGFMNNFID